MAQRRTANRRVHRVSAQAPNRFDPDVFDQPIEKIRDSQSTVAYFARIRNLHRDHR